MSEKKELKEKDLYMLSSLREGEEGSIYSIFGRRGILNRLASMGLVPGTKIKVLRNSWGPVIVLASNTRLAIGRGQATKIFIAKDHVSPFEKIVNTKID
ncbi:MAG: ferrous iron transport protein A [Nitrospirae bacterium]|nr:ferrous iron transport protein A [Nitrospirota bacterium]